jgi:hypothetical protein
VQLTVYYMKHCALCAVRCLTPQHKLWPYVVPSQVENLS